MTTEPTSPAPKKRQPLLLPTVEHPEEVKAFIVEFAAMTEDDFRQALAANTLDEVPEETAAFYSDELVERTMLAAEFLIANTNSALHKRADEGDKEWMARARFFQNEMGSVRRRAQLIAQGVRARQGRISNAPNARARAARELQRLHAEEYVGLVRKHQAAIAEEKRKAKAAAKAARRRERPASK